MKVVHEIDVEQYADLLRSILEDELRGIDPGAWWKKLYPHATEVEFLVRFTDSPHGRTNA